MKVTRGHLPAEYLCCGIFQHTDSVIRNSKTAYQETDLYAAQAGPKLLLAWEGG